jgi:prepilin-type processing-associated H-X9-DG protein
MVNGQWLMVDGHVTNDKPLHGGALPGQSMVDDEMTINH